MFGKFLKVVLSNSSSGFLEVFQNVSLDIGCVFTHFYSGPCTWPASEECFLFVKLINTVL